MLSMLCQRQSFYCLQTQQRKDVFQSETRLQIWIIICCRVGGPDVRPVRFSRTDLFPSKYSSTREPATNSAHPTHPYISAPHSFWLWTCITWCQDKGVPLPTVCYRRFVVRLVLQQTLHMLQGNQQETLWNFKRKLLKNKRVQECFASILRKHFARESHYLHTKLETAATRSKLYKDILG